MSSKRDGGRVPPRYRETIKSPTEAVQEVLRRNEVVEQSRKAIVERAKQDRINPFRPGLRLNYPEHIASSPYLPHPQGLLRRWPWAPVFLLRCGDLVDCNGHDQYKQAESKLIAVSDGGLRLIRGEVRRELFLIAQFDAVVSVALYQLAIVYMAVFLVGMTLALPSVAAISGVAALLFAILVRLASSVFHRSRNTRAKEKGLPIRPQGLANAAYSVLFRINAPLASKWF